MTHMTSDTLFAVLLILFVSTLVGCASLQPVKENPNQMLFYMMQQKSIDKALDVWSSDKKKKSHPDITCDELRDLLQKKCLIAPPVKDPLPQIPALPAFPPLPPVEDSPFFHG